MADICCIRFTVPYANKAVDATVHAVQVMSFEITVACKKKIYNIYTFSKKFK